MWWAVTVKCNKSQATTLSGLLTFSYILCSPSVGSYMYVRMYVFVYRYMDLSTGFCRAQRMAFDPNKPEF